MNIKNFLRLFTLALVMSSVITSCKKDYEAPPQSSDPNLTVTTTIAQLKAKHTVSGAYDVIDSNLIISGVVIANDKSGNLYKEMYIRDATGAIALELASGGLYANFPVGRKVFVKCKGMCLSDYRNMIQLGRKSISNGIVSLEGVPAPLIPNYVIGGSLGHFAEAAPKAIVATDLVLNPTATIMQTPLLGDLVKLSGYEFLASDTKRSYADTSNNHSTLSSMVNIKSCSGEGPFIVLTSGYADFAAKAPQAGNGDITALFTVYGTTKQFIIRDTTDVQFNGPRCFLFEQDFGGIPVSTNCISLAGWQNIKEVGDVCYTGATFGGNIFAKISAFSSALYDGSNNLTSNIKSWLIPPSITIPAGISPKLTYTCAHRYTAGTLKLLISTDYNGTSQTPSTATWVELNSIQANSPIFTPFNPYGPFNLSAYAGKTVYLGFRYDVPSGSNKNAVATFEPDDIKISKN
jgi:hypothetical protein